jgi:hypothetical protein
MVIYLVRWYIPEVVVKQFVCVREERVEERLVGRPSSSSNSRLAMDDFFSYPLLDRFVSSCFGGLKMVLVASDSLFVAFYEKLGMYP